MTPERYQQVGQIYLAALEFESDQRAAYLAEACVGDEALRKEVESLLGYQARSGGIIDQHLIEAAVRAMANDPTSKVIGQDLGHYRILSLLGKGGMGEVYLGEDTRLGRKVAIKLLPTRFTTDAGRVRRFAQEARAVSALNHPNIITIYEIGEAATENGSAHYIATEYVEGETLRQRMANAPHNRMKVVEAVDVAAQVAAALTAAHEAGIAHRDIKPENVMVRRDGYVKVLDFGLAKLTEPSAPGVDTQDPMAPGASTETGIVIGTPRYMSPEQARGEKVDVRTDIFSLGVMMYEMVAGRAPFEGATPSETIASILRDEPAPLIRQVPEAPPELDRIVCRALAKDRAERYQHQPARDLLNDLNLLKQEMLIAKNRKPQAASRKRRIHILSALAPLLLSAIAMWFYFNRPPVLTGKDAILLADFENKTGDAVFDGMLKQALEIQLQQSPFLNIFPEARIRQTLRFMNRPPDARVTAEVAREICQRHDLKALIAGSIAPLGSHYVITLEAINSQSGESLAREQIEAESKEQVLRRLSQAVTQLREKLGESLSSIQRFDRPLEQATTAKLEAFKAWSLGIEHSYGGRPTEAIPFYKRAVELDPDFAHAYSVLSVVYSIHGQLGLAAEAAEKGYKLRDKVDEYEKLRITNFYHAFATGNLDRRIEALTLQKQIYPHVPSGPHDLAQTYITIGQYDQAVAEAREAIRLNPNFAPAHRVLVWALLRLNRFAEAKDALERAQQQHMDPPDFHAILYQIAFIGGGAEGMQQQIDWARGRPYEHMAFDWQTGAAASAGQWRKAQQHARRAIDLTARGETKEITAGYAVEQALRGAVFGDCRQVSADAAQGLKLERGRVSLTRSALALALCGESNQAKPLMDELTKRYPEDTVINSIWLPVIRAGAELRRGNAEQVIEQLQAVTRYEAAAEFWPQHLRGQAYLKLKRGAEAAAEFQKILDHRGYAPLSPLYPLARLGLARAAALTGAAAQSRKACEEFFAAWKEADVDLPILREARREYELMAKR
jgi:serine/threonine protein kinase/predicted Zn-dependent protease